MTEDVHMHTWARPLSGALTMKGRLEVKQTIPSSCWCGARQCNWYRDRHADGTPLLDKNGRRTIEFCNAEAMKGAKKCRVHGG